MKGDHIKKSMLGRACRTHGRRDRWKQKSGQETLTEETTCKAYSWIGG